MAAGWENDHAESTGTCRRVTLRTVGALRLPRSRLLGHLIPAVLADEGPQAFLYESFTLPSQFPNWGEG